MKTKNIRFLSTCFLVAFMIGSFAFAGDESRVGTSGGNQVLVPVGARDLAMSGSDIVYTSGMNAVHWNPAGLSRMNGGAVVISNMTYFGDIGVNYLGAGFKSNVGTFGLSVKTLSFGDIPTTTIEHMDGTGTTFSPTFATIGFSFAKAIIENASVGVNAKIVYESLPRAAASALVFDAGVQYQNFAGFEGLGIGLVIKNIGQDLKYDGSALLVQASDVGNSYNDFRKIEAAEDQLPSVYEVGMSYKLPIGLTLAGTFVSNNYDYDQLRLGGEFGIGGMLYLRGGLLSPLASDDSELADEDKMFSTTFGGGIKYNLFGLDTHIDFTYRTQKYFDGNMLWSLGIDF